MVSSDQVINGHCFLVGLEYISLAIIRFNSNGE